MCVVADNHPRIVYPVSRCAKVPFRTRDVRKFPALVQKSDRNGSAIHVHADNACAVVLDIASPSGASFGLRVIQCGELLAFENITVRDAATVRVYPPTNIPALLLPPGLVDMALGTLALVNVKVSGGASAAMAATTVNASANASRQDGFAVFHGFLLT